ncbi:MAG: hypothetical protein ACFBSE_25935 [Prochloraceae cyanobacterium]
MESNLNESDIIILISIFLGLASGITFGLVDWLLDRLIKNDNFVSLKLRASKCIYMGIIMAIIFGIMTFISIAIDPDPDLIQKLDRDNINIALVIGLLVPILNKFIDFIFLKNRSKQ